MILDHEGFPRTDVRAKTLRRRVDEVRRRVVAEWKRPADGSDPNPETLGFDALYELRGPKGGGGIPLASVIYFRVRDDGDLPGWYVRLFIMGQQFDSWSRFGSDSEACQFVRRWLRAQGHELRLDSTGALKRRGASA